MAWMSDERLKVRDYRSIDERSAFRGGYSDGYYGYPRAQSDWPNAYSAGYWEGSSDAKEDKQ